jgi:hypothetical protein
MATDMRSHSGERGFTDSGVVVKIIIAAVIIAVYYGCNAWIVGKKYERMGYEYVDPTAPEQNRGPEKVDRQEYGGGMLP